MKKIILLISMFFVLNSCSTDGDDTNYNFELLKIESVDIADSFIVGQTYPVVMRYKKPSTCHYYNGFYYDKGTGTESNVRSIAIESAVALRDDCEVLTDEIVECSFNFIATAEGSYIFKFYQGKDDLGNNVFLEYEIPVSN